ncbi:MAG: KH domain-containing protein [Bacilli bacterium]
MDLVALTEYLVKSIVSEIEMVSVTKYDDDDEMTTIEVLVSENDMGAVVGKEGSIANAIRTIIQTSAYNNKLKKVKVNFDSY